MVIIIKKGTPEAAIRQLLAQLSMQNVKGGCGYTCAAGG